jgi:hypothetical protein
MTPLQREHKLAKSCLIYIQNLSTEVKLDFISDIILSIKKDKEPKTSRGEYYAGIWDSEQSAEEIIESINSNKGISTRNIIDL